MALIFHKVVWQHMQGALGFLIRIQLQILQRNLPVKKISVNRLRFDRIMVMSLWPRFLAHPV